MSEKVLQIVTDRMIAKLEAGVVPWHKPWNTKLGLQRNGYRNYVYRGFNQFITAMQGYESPLWFTHKELETMRQYVLPEQKGLPIVWPLTKFKINDAGDKEFYFVGWRYYLVWNAVQTTIGHHPEGIEVVETPSYDTIYEGYKNPPKLGNGTTQAYYQPRTDTVSLPSKASFDSIEHYYATLYHELIHSTGIPDRLNRYSVEKFEPFGSESYAFEELVAEMGSCYLCSHVGITDEGLFNNNASYVAGWLKALKDDRGLVVKAANAASRAFYHIIGKESENGNDQQEES